ncbi:MAG: alanine racemase [Woeseiaceae bacterium]
MTFGARAVIRLGALKHNLKVIREMAPGTRVMAVIKANAYGHGMLEVANALADADSFAVARTSEARALREADIDSPIVILEGVFTGEELDMAIDAGFEIVVHCIEQFELLEQLESGQLTVWLKFDTGMNRLGFRVPDAEVLINRARECRAIGELRLMSHLANANDRQDDKTADQLSLFQSIADGFDGDVSIANSPGLFGWPESMPKPAGDIWIRPGISLYGISPFDGTSGADLGLRPVMQLESRLISVKTTSAGEPVGYGGTWAAEQDSMIGVVAAGYGDGYSRFLPSGTPVLVNNRRVPLAGGVSMDMIAIDLGPGASDRVGDPVLLWGDGLSVEEIARYAGTIPYQLVCGVLNREPSMVVD